MLCSVAIHWAHAQAQAAGVGGFAEREEKSKFIHLVFGAVAKVADAERKAFSMDETDGLVAARMKVFSTEFTNRVRFSELLEASA